MFLMALSDFVDPPQKITVVFKDAKKIQELSCRVPLDAVLHVLEEATDEYPLKNDKTTFYVCKGRTCLPPANELNL